MKNQSFCWKEPLQAFTSSYKKGFKFTYLKQLSDTSTCKFALFANQGAYLSQENILFKKYEVIPKLIRKLNSVVRSMTSHKDINSIYYLCFALRYRFSTYPQKIFISVECS